MGEGNKEGRREDRRKKGKERGGNERRGKEGRDGSEASLSGRTAIATVTG